jgi:hypothetical protein
MRKLHVQRRLTWVRGGYTIFKSLEDTEYPLDKGKKFRLLDHTADLGILVYGRDLEELFSNAGEAFFDIITDLYGFAKGKGEHGEDHSSRKPEFGRFDGSLVGGASLRA